MRGSDFIFSSFSLFYCFLCEEHTHIHYEMLCASLCVCKYEFTFIDVTSLCLLSASLFFIHSLRCERDNSYPFRYHLSCPLLVLRNIFFSFPYYTCIFHCAPLHPLTFIRSLSSCNLSPSHIHTS